MSVLFRHFMGGLVCETDTKLRRQVGDAIAVVFPHPDRKSQDAI